MILLKSMRSDKNIAFELRKQGKTYREIENELSIARSTLCNWFRDVPWSAHIRKTNTDKHIKRSIEHLKKLNDGRRKWLNDFYTQLDIEAESEFRVYVNDPLFVAGLMLYAGEGDKSDNVAIRFVNSDLDLHKIFQVFIVKYLEKDVFKLKFSVLLYPDLDEDTCLLRWSNEMNIKRENFYKTQIIQGRHKTRKLQFGVGTIILVGTKYKRKLLYWISLYKKSISIDAGLV